MDPIPKYLQECLKNTEFFNKIRKYNAAFSFISFSANDDKFISKNNIYTFRIQGQIYHRIGPLENLDENRKTQNAQIYFKGENEEILRQKYSSELNGCILILIQAMLLDDCKNQFILQFKKASQLAKSNVTNLKYFLK